MNKLISALASGMVVVGLNSIPAHAIDGTAADAEIVANSNTYEPAFFAAYAPRTALDMVGRIPGFQLQFGDDKRGLGQGGANILINGKRISGKTNPRDQLGRITAPNVVRIEIVDGAGLSIPGLTGQVANVITKTTGVTGTWEWNPEWRPGLEANLFPGSVSVSGERGNLSYSAQLESDTFRNGNRGPETLFTPDGTVFEIREEDGQFYGDNPGVSVDLSWKPKENHVGNLNAEYQLFNFNGQDVSIRTAVTDRGETIQTVFTNAEDEWNLEISGDYEFPVGPGKLKTIGYYRFERSPTVSRFDVFDPSLGQMDGSRFFRDADEAEIIARTEYSWNPSEGRDWQFGLEGAFNYLDIASSLLVLDSTGEFVDEPLDGATSRVEEKRAEATITHTRTLSPKWDLQASIGGEYSEINEIGVQIRDFVRPKGFVTATYKPNETLDIRTKIEREVGQLNFFDFISSLDLNTDQRDSRNSNLVPEQTWLAEMEFDKDFGQGNTFKARIYGELISDLVDRIPVRLTDGELGDAVGNIDSAKRYGVDFSTTIKGEKWGLNGMQIEANLDLRHSSVEDPLTGVSRRLNRDKRIFYFAEFRHDIPNTDWAYGVAMDRFAQSAVFRLDTVNQFSFPTPFAWIYVEHKDIYGLKVKASIRNLLGSSDDFRRDIFVGSRDQGVLDFTEDRTRPFGQFFRLEVSGTF